MVKSWQTLVVVPTKIGTKQYCVPKACCSGLWRLSGKGNSIVVILLTARIIEVVEYPAILKCKQLFVPLV